MQHKRSPKARLILILIALGTLIVGYYLGQYWQRQPLSDLTAVVYPEGKPVVYPGDLDIGEATDQWRLFAAVDTTNSACQELLRRYGLVRNRLAGWPKIQQRLHLMLLAYDQPDEAAAEGFRAGQDWIEVISADPQLLDPLAASLGILPSPSGACSATQSNAILVAPDQRRWALIPFEQAAIMARNIATIIQFVE